MGGMEGFYFVLLNDIHSLNHLTGREIRPIPHIKVLLQVLWSTAAYVVKISIKYLVASEEAACDMHLNPNCLQ